MANISSSISTPKTIRDLLISYKETNYEIGITRNGTGSRAYNVDVIWDGNNYYIAYNLTDDENTVIIESLASVLPITISQPATTE